MQNPFEDMYYHLAKAQNKAENLLAESLETVSNIPQESKNKDQITANLLSTQIYKVIDDLKTALANTEEMLLSTTEEP